MIAGLALLAYFAAAASLGVRLDNRAGVVASSCISGKPSTCVAAWSWLGLPIVLALDALL